MLKKRKLKNRGKKGKGKKKVPAKKWTQALNTNFLLNKFYFAPNLLSYHNQYT